jgi:hypothetical protein
VFGANAFGWIYFGQSHLVTAPAAADEDIFLAFDRPEPGARSGQLDRPSDKQR